LSDMTVTELTAKYYSPRREGLQPRIYVWPENESIYENFFNRRVRPVSVMKKVALKVLRDHGIEAELADISWQPKAGCGSCSCSPGFVLRRSLVDWNRWSNRGRYTMNEFADAFKDVMDPDTWYSWGSFEIDIVFDGPKVRPEAQAAADNWNSNGSSLDDLVSIGIPESVA